MKHISLILSLVCLLLLDACKSKEPAPIPKPNAAFTFDVGMNGFVEFVNTSTNATSYNWVFGNGETSFATSPGVVYKTNGTYAVTLIAKSEGGESTTVRSVVVNTVPTTGQILFWSTHSTSIDVSISGVFKGTTAVYYNSSDNAPNCGSNGNVTVTLPGGSYSYSAKSKDFFPKTWSGTVTVTNGKCSTWCLLK